MNFDENEFARLLANRAANQHLSEPRTADEVDESVINPATGEPMKKEGAARVKKLRVLRAQAKKAARSSNPVKRAAAEQAEHRASSSIRHEYLKDHQS